MTQWLHRVTTVMAPNPNTVPVATHMNATSSRRSIAQAGASIVATVAYAAMQTFVGTNLELVPIATGTPRSIASVRTEAEPGVVINSQPIIVRTGALGGHANMGGGAARHHRRHRRMKFVRTHTFPALMRPKTRVRR